MADSDKLGLGLDDIIRIDRTSNRRGGGGRGGQRGFRARGGGGGGGGGRGGGQMNGFRTRGGGGLVNSFILFILIYVFLIFSLEHRMHQQAVGNMIFLMIILIELEVYNEVLA